MPDYEQKDMDGVAFKNDKKSEDWHADWNGSAMIEGTMYWVNMYDNVSKVVRTTGNCGSSLRMVHLWQQEQLSLMFPPRKTMIFRGD